MMQRLVRIQYKYINYKLNLVYSNGRQSNVYCLINNVYAEEECGGKCSSEHCIAKPVKQKRTKLQSLHIFKLLPLTWK